MRVLFLLLAFLPSALVSAENSRPVQCRFLNFAGADGSASSVLALSEKGATVECQLATSSLSSPVVCFATDNKITFLSSSDRKPMVTATIPAEVKTAILIFVKVPKPAEAAPATEQPWRVFVIDDSPKNFPDGGAFVANFYNKEIRFVIGEHKGMLRPAGNHGYARPAERDAFNMASVSFEFLQGDKWRTANETTLRFLSGMRYLMFAYVDPESGRPRINTYQDIAPPAPAKTSP